MQQDVVVIGGGLGGLMTGALLARNGVKVLVLEKNHTAGGGLQNFTRNGISYDTGMHVMGGWQPGGTLDRITRYLGIRESLDIKECDRDSMDVITCLSDGAVYQLPKGKDSMIIYLSALFPDEREGITEYFRQIDIIADSFDLYNLRPYSHTGAMDIPEIGLLPVDKFVEQFVSAQRLRAILSYINGLYGAEKGRTPAYIHALIARLYMNGTMRFVGGSAQLAEALSAVISSAGGKILTDSEVTYIDVDDQRHVTSVICKDGARYAATRYIWAAHPDMLLKVIKPGSFTKAYTRRIGSVKPTCSAFSVYIELKPNCFPYINHTCYLHDTLDDSWELTRLDRDGIPAGLMFMTPPEHNQRGYATTMLVTALMDFNCVKEWEYCLPGHRTYEYNQWKNKVSDGIINKISQLYPTLLSSINNIYTASPLTIRDYFNAPQGSIYGFSKDCNNLLESQLPVVTKVDNLFLTGQCNNLHGICGVPLTAIITAEALLHPATIIDKL